MVGASPPASGLLRDKPTLDALNAMGIDVGTLGNHEFDRGRHRRCSARSTADSPRWIRPSRSTS